ncbi:hypothetical protein L6R53_31355 [Myxococcota bacterium]|nr:hypothetical protein [Myxococcota bacterium]
MTPLAAALLLSTACTDKGTASPDPTTPAEGDGGTVTTPSDGGRPLTEDGPTVPTGTTDGGTTIPGDPIPTFTCPAPPKDARVFHAGTLISDQFYLKDTGKGDLWEVIVTGISYVHDQPCRDLVAWNAFDRQVKAGEKPGEYHFELIADIPGSGLNDWLGTHDSGGGYRLNGKFAAHQLKIGWRDGPDEDYDVVYSLPFGWTESTLCVGYLSPDRLYLTVLWDPVEGPYRTNDYTSLDVPIWFDMEIWPTDLDPVYGGHRSCAQTGWSGWTTDDLFAGYDWLGKDG